MWCQRSIHLRTQDLEHPSLSAMPLLLLMQRDDAGAPSELGVMVVHDDGTCSQGMIVSPPPTAYIAFGTRGLSFSHTHRMRFDPWINSSLTNNEVRVVSTTWSLSFSIRWVLMWKGITLTVVKIYERHLSSISSELDISRFLPGPVMLVYDRGPVYMIRIFQRWLKQLCRFTIPDLVYQSLWVYLKNPKYNV